MAASGRTRLYSEFVQDDGAYSVSSSAGGHSMALSTVACIIPDVVRPTKRCKTTGLNSRFDRMAETLQVVYHSPTESTRGRSRSSGSSSVSSYDIPKTPIDAYSDLHNRRGGKTFSVIKMNTGQGNPWKHQVEDGRPGQGHEPLKQPLPSWLSRTFSSLKTGHPLRLLLPSSRCRSFDIPLGIPIGLEELGSPLDHSIQDEGSVFAFSIPLANLPTPQTYVNRGPGHEPSLESGPASSLEFAINHNLASTESDLALQSMGLTEPTSNILPFSTPGPGVCPPYSDTQIPPPCDELHNNEYSYVSPQEDSTFSSGLLRTPVDAMHYSTHFPIQHPSDEPLNAPFIRDVVMHEDCFSDPLIHPYTKGNPFSIPGPLFLSRSVYLDSSSEDPSDSDLLHPDLDYENLGFRWERFDRKSVGVNEHRAGVPLPNGSVDPVAMYPQSSPPNIMPFSRTGTISSHEQLRSPISLNHKVAFEPDTPENLFINEMSPSTPDSPDNEPVFDPAPGIFISPLRNRPWSHSEDEIATNTDSQAEDAYKSSYEITKLVRKNAGVGKGKLSQHSNDNIES